VPAIRHAQAAQDWDRAARLLADYWPGLHLDGQAATIRELLSGFAASQSKADAELAVLNTLDELTQGSLETAEWYMARAESAMEAVPDARQDQAQLLLGIARLLHARQRGNLPAVAEQARLLQAKADASGATQPGLGEDLRTLALINLGSAEWSAAQINEAQRHLDAGVALARQIGRPYLEFTGLAYLERWSGVGRRSSWPSGTAGSRSRRLVSRACKSQRCWSIRGGWRRQNPGSRGLNVGSGQTPSQPWEWGSGSCVGCSRWRGGGTPTRSPPSKQATGWPGGSPSQAFWFGRTDHCCCKPWFAWVRPNAPNRPLLNSTTKTATMGQCESAWRRCGWPNATPKKP
jgi:hypothetical protein